MDSSERRFAHSTRNWIDCKVQLAVPRLWWGPLWAAFCGAVASGSFVWGADQIARLILVLALADPLLANLCRLSFDMDWPRDSGGAREGTAIPDVMGLPYTEVGSPAHRLGRFLGRAFAWWRRVFCSETAWMASGIVFQGGAMVAIALALEPPAGWAVGGGLGLIGMALLVARRSPAVAAVVRDAVEVGVPWLVGHLVFAPLKPFAIGLVGIYVLAYVAAAHVMRKGSGRGALLVALALGSTVSLMAAGKWPVAAAVVGLVGLYPLWLSMVAFSRQTSPEDYVRRTNVYMCVTMLVAAFSLGAV